MAERGRCATRERGIREGVITACFESQVSSFESTCDDPVGAIHATKSRRRRIEMKFLRSTTLVATMLCTAMAWGAEKPNVILIMTDDQGYGDLGCHGNPVLKTPNLDRMHGESVRFTDFHVSPFCTPTRAALMTGRDPGRTGPIAPAPGERCCTRDERTMANVFADNGYATGMFGKWHLGDNAPHRPQDHGFQDVVWHRCGGIGQVSDYWGNDYFDDTYERNGKLEKFEGYCTDVWFRRGDALHRGEQGQAVLPLPAAQRTAQPLSWWSEEWSEPYQDKVDRCDTGRLLRHDCQHRPQLRRCCVSG